MKKNAARLRRNQDLKKKLATDGHRLNTDLLSLFANSTVLGYGLIFQLGATGKASAIAGMTHTALAEPVPPKMLRFDMTLADLCRRCIGSTDPH